MLRKSKKEIIVSRSSAESEYWRGLTDLTYEIVCIHDILTTQESMKVYCNNQLAIYIIQNHVFYERVKHIEVDRHVVQKNSDTSRIEPKHVYSENQLSFVD